MLTDEQERAVDEIIANADGEARRNAELFEVGDIDFATFRARVFGEVRQAYQAVGNLVDADPADIRAALNEQLYPSDGFSLTERFVENEEGERTIPQLLASITMYLRSARTAAYDTAVKREIAENGEPLAVRRLGTTPNHCLPCLLYAALPPQPLSRVVLPGLDCNCYTNCLCTIEVIGSPTPPSILSRPPQG